MVRVTARRRVVVGVAGLVEGHLAVPGGREPDRPALDEARWLVPEHRHLDRQTGRSADRERPGGADLGRTGTGPDRSIAWTPIRR